ncbi:MAG: hypothetical protein ACJAZ9_000198 [Neolewinella sp.]|jgi:hypothetical protein
MENFLKRRRATSHPTRFQGWGRSKNYFEGWYFKVVIPEQNLAFAFIPGISYATDGTSHSFLQVLDGVKATSAYHRYDTEDFQPAEEEFSLKLGPHFFATNQLRVDLPGLKLDLELYNIHPWQKRPMAAGIMGYYGYIPKMQCYHGLVSYYHDLAGKVTIDGVEYDAAGGVGYTEKDWGSGFPSAWVWCQSNHLSGTERPASLMASVANIPWLGSSFTGFLATFLFEGELHLFTTWARSQVQAEFSEAGEVKLTFSAPGKRLTVKGKPAPGGDLVSPVTGQAMTGRINESLQAELDVELRLNGRVVYTGVASWAGLEVSERAGEL